MKYKHAFTGQMCVNIFDDEYKNGKVFDGIIIGKTHVFKRGLAQIKFIPLSSIDRAYMRKVEGTCTTCTSFVVTDSMLVLQGKSDDVFLYRNERERVIRDILSYLKERGVSVGVYR